MSKYDHPVKNRNPNERYAALDAVILSGRRRRNLRHIALAAATIVAPPSSQIEDFLLPNDDQQDSVAWVCRGIRANGMVRLGVLNFDKDCLMSEYFNDEHQS